MSRSDKVEAAIEKLSTRRRREMLISKWRTLPSLYWSIVVGILAVFSVLQTTLLTGWSSLAVIWLLLALMGVAFVAAVAIAIKQKTPIEKLAMARALYTEAGRRFDERDYSFSEK